MRPRRKRLRRTLATLLALYLLLLIVVFATHLPDLLIIHAAPGPLDTPDGQSTLIPSPTGQLEVCIARSPAAQSAAPALYVLFFVGNEDRVNPWTAGVARMWEHDLGGGGKPVEAWGVNLPGFGLSTGPAYLSRIGPAALAAFDALHAKAGTTPIAVQAASLGTLAALDIAAHRPIAALSLQDPPPLAALVLERNSWWNAGLLSLPIALSLPADIDSVTNARHSTAPLLFITSQYDTVVPPLFQQRIFDAYAGPKHHIVLPGAHHCGQPDPAMQLQLAALRHDLLQKPPG
ncbi:MAG TPA: hypothetical protein VHQ47_13210 [Phycisphaerae bacterium]|nr:hypothetical protein [Phycisphaerae bacterium]